MIKNKTQLLGFLPSTTRRSVKFALKLGYPLIGRGALSFNGKIQRRKADTRCGRLAPFADKLAVRDFVVDRLGRSVLTELAFVGENVSGEEISDLAATGESFVSKANHNSGPVQFIRPGVTRWDLERISNELNRQLTLDYGLSSGEFWYSHIRRQILIECALVNTRGDVPDDYKCHVFNSSKGTVVRVQVDYDRFGSRSKLIFDEAGCRLDIKRISRLNEAPPPLSPHFATIVNHSRRLAEGFDYVRVDWLDAAEGPKFCELTFAPASGFGRFYPRSVDFEWGSFWEYDPRVPDWD